MLGRQIFEFVDALARHSESDRNLTRRCFTAEHRAVIELLRQWMQRAGMSVRLDAMGNIIGRRQGDGSCTRTLLMGSHLDTVRDGGRFDGMLGVVLPLACMQALEDAGERLPYAVEIVGFCDEEGVRFQSTLLGSRALAGTLDPAVLEATDDDGISLRQAMSEFGLDPDALAAAARAPEEFIGYLEVHIEQGPVLEAEGLPVGVVTAIAGASRFRVQLAGLAGHAGTVPMALRRDALAAAAEAVLAVEACCAQMGDVVGTVGRLAVSPGAVNVIPGEVEFSLDVRCGEDARRGLALERIRAAFEEIGRRRGVRIRMQSTHDNASSTCSEWLSARLAAAIERCGLAVRRLPSGAGHDAMAIAGLCQVGMLFVRCEGGISHHPDENMSEEDADTAARVLLSFLRDLQPETGP